MSVDDIYARLGEMGTPIASDCLNCFEMTCKIGDLSDEEMQKYADVLYSIAMP